MAKEQLQAAPMSRIAALKAKLAAAAASSSTDSGSTKEKDNDGKKPGRIAGLRSRMGFALPGHKKAKEAAKQAAAGPRKEEQQSVADAGQTQDGAHSSGLKRAASVPGEGAADPEPVGARRSSDTIANLQSKLNLDLTRKPGDAGRKPVSTAPSSDSIASMSTLSSQ